MSSGREAGNQIEELALLRQLSARVRTRVMIDVGAHHGATLEPFLAAGFEVHAFEPIEANRRRLLERLQSAQNLMLRSEAVSNRAGSAELHPTARGDRAPHDPHHSLERIPADRDHREAEATRVRTVALDDLAASSEIPAEVGVLKIDTEGHDLAVLEGAAGLDCEVVVVEFWGAGHPFGAPPSPIDEMVRLMSERGFHSYVVVARRGGAVQLGFDSIEAIDAAAWGNVFFFHQRAEDVYAEISLWSRSGAAQSIAPLLEQLSRSRGEDAELRFFDVGAFRGEFTSEILAAFPRSTGTLFEPASENAAALEDRFAADPRVEVRRTALSAGEGEREFSFFAEAPATGSLLAAHSPPEEPSLRSVDVTTLDSVWEDAGRSELQLIKLDTQGEDLRVLEGGRGMLAAQRPVIVVEAIFIPSYRGQAAPHELLAFAADHGYRPVRMINVHHTRSGHLAFADLVLLHESESTPESGPPYVLWDPDNAEHLQKALQAADEDRRAKQRAIERLQDQEIKLRRSRGLLEGELEQVRSSASWKATAPLRALKRRLGRAWGRRL